MFDDFDTMIQSDELAALYFFEEDSDGQEDFQEISRRTPRIS